MKPSANGSGGASRRRLVDLGIFILLATLICVAGRDAIVTPNVEVGDFAANSLLIQDAKSLHLLVGNYSRVGFNHPGPAILDTLAFGEWFFYDLLHLASSPFSGQLIAVACYSAFWSLCLFRLMRRMTGSPRMAAVGLVIFLLVTAISDPAFLTGAWFPNLYYFPFAVTLLAAARLARGTADSVQSLALGAGFLINGHVSFAAVLVLLFVGLIGFNVVACRRGEPDACFLRRAFWTLNGRAVALGWLTFLAFLVPLAVETVRHFPGPVAAYMAFGSQQEPNSFEAVGRYISVYWGGAGTLPIPVLASVVLVFLSRSLRAGHDLRSTLWMLVVATIALGFYVRYGVDLLDQVYIAFFYYAVPALLAAMLALVVIELDSSRHKPFVLAAAMVCAIAVYSMISKPVGYQAQYNDPTVIDLYRSLETVKSDKRLVLDLSQSSDWGTIWSKVLGAQIYAKRRHEDLFCINKGWHISFTPRGHCSPEEAITNRRLVVRGPNTRLPDAIHPEIVAAGLTLYAYQPPTGTDLMDVKVAEHASLFQDYFLGTGWSGVEGPFVWSDSDEAHVVLDLGKEFVGNVSFDLGAFLPHPDSTQDVEIYVANRRVGAAHLSQATPRQKVVAHVQTLGVNRIDFTLKILHPISPKEAGLSDDFRRLGVSLFGFEVTPG